MVGLLGGSFDPIHHGHLIGARRLLEKLELSAVRLVPAREQPFKRGSHGAEAEDRARMVELAVQEEPDLSLESCELDRPGPSWTVDTLRHLRATEPEEQFVLLLGADAARELDKWREAADLPGLATIVVFARPGSPPPASPLVHRVVEIPAVGISSTEIRERVRGGRSIRYLVPPAVEDHIRGRSLYI